MLFTALIAVPWLAGHLSVAPTMTPLSIRADIDREGAKALVDQLWSSRKWDYVEDRIASGQRAWIELAPALAPGTDAAASEGLGISLASALPKNPNAVLAVLDLSDGPVLGPSRVCGVPFIEPTAAFVRRYAANTARALKAVRSPSSAKARAACMRVLNSTIATLKARGLLTRQ